MDRARHPGPPRPGRRGARRPRGALTRRGRRRAALLAFGTALACTPLSTDLAEIVAIEIVLPDSGIFEVGDTLFPRARAINSRGDSVGGGSITWAALDTAAAVLDPATGATLGKAGGNPRIQARVGNLRSDPVVLIVQPPLAAIAAEGDVRDTVTLSGTPKDTTSDSLRVRVFATEPPSQTLLRRLVVYEFVVFPTGVAAVTLIPNDTAYTAASGIAVVQVRLDTGGPLDSVVVTARATRHDGTPAPGSPLTFVVEFRQ